MEATKTRTRTQTDDGLIVERQGPYRATSWNGTTWCLEVLQDGGGWRRMPGQYASPAKALRAMDQL